jgi:hypothetical protein
MRSEDSREIDEARCLELARVNPVGILEVPIAYSPVSEDGEEGGARSRVAGGTRLAALVLLALFAFVTVATTVSSLGAYCLTTDGGDLRELPGAAPR